MDTSKLLNLLGMLREGHDVEMDLVDETEAVLDEATAGSLAARRDAMMVGVLEEAARRLKGPLSNAAKLSLAKYKWGVKGKILRVRASGRYGGSYTMAVELQWWDREPVLKYRATGKTMKGGSIYKTGEQAMSDDSTPGDIAGQIGTFVTIADSEMIEGYTPGALQMYGDKKTGRAPKDSFQIRGGKYR